MTRKPFGLAIALALLAGSLAPASAADWNNGAGSIKDYGAAAVPVPAPVPVPVYKSAWYFRADFGIGLGDDPDVDEVGYTYGPNDTALPESWLQGNFGTFNTWGFGVGHYWSDSFRTDITAEVRSQAKVNFDGGVSYTDGDENVILSVDDETTLRGGVFLINAYYDLPIRSFRSLTPYIGGGVGFAWNELTRNHTSHDQACYNATAVAPIVATCPSLGSRDGAAAHEKDLTVSFAAAAMVGATYNVSDSIDFDFNYRFLYLGSTESNIAVTGNDFNGNSLVKIGDTNEHQLRAGLRFNVN